MTLQLNLTEVKYESSDCNLSFVIMNAPTDKNIYSYVRRLKELNVSTIVRVCEPTYSPDRCIEAGITVKDHAFSDGANPPSHIVESWLDLVKQATEEGKTIAVHCVAGLGRAPVLVVLALIEFAKMNQMQAIKFVRSKRRDAINRKQVEYLCGYTPSRQSKQCCVIC